MTDKLLPFPSNKANLVVELLLVFATMWGIKWLADVFGIIGAGSIGIWMGILLASWFMRVRAAKWKDLGFGLPKGRRTWLIQLGLTILTVIGVFLIMSLVLDPLMSKFGLETPDDAADRFSFFLGKPFVFLSYLVLVAWIGAALGEEILFRGYLLNRLTDLFGSSNSSTIMAVLLQAVVFGVLHSYQGLAGIITTSVIALIFGAMYFVAKRKLFVVILAHLIINTISLTGFYLSDGVVN